MALQTSGAISFANLQSEFGGSHPITMGEYAAFRVSGSGSTISMNQFYGASSSLDTQTVTVGYTAGSAYTPGVYGYVNLNPGVTGAVSDGTCNFKSGAAYRRLQFLGTSTGTLMFGLSGSHANSGWTTMTIGSTSYSRSSASFQQFGTTEARWTWTSQTSNPYGTTTGATRTVTFT